MNVFDWGRTVVPDAAVEKPPRADRDTRNGASGTRITLDVTRTYLTLLDAWNGIEVARENVAQAEENYRVTNERFKEGLATNTDLLDAEVLLAQPRRRRTAIDDGDVPDSPGRPRAGHGRHGELTR